MQLIAGNWKMNGLKAQVAELEALIAGAPPADAELLLCPPATLVNAFARMAAGSHVRIGGQDCHWKASGPHTGDVSAAMLADSGASHVIVGHSERRTDHGETDAIVRAKAEAAQGAGLLPIICVGETLAEREAGQTFQVVARQLQGSCPDEGEFVIAYEPVWAIGSGLTPEPHEVEAVHKAIAAQMKGGRRILYGGSVNPGNAGVLLALPSVDGALVGGASLKARDFLAIAAAARRP